MRYDKPGVCLLLVCVFTYTQKCVCVFYYCVFTFQSLLPDSHEPLPYNEGKRLFRVEQSPLAAQGDVARLSSARIPSHVHLFSPSPLCSARSADTEARADEREGSASNNHERAREAARGRAGPNTIHPFRGLGGHGTACRQDDQLGDESWYR